MSDQTAKGEVAQKNVQLHEDNPNGRDLKRRAWEQLGKTGNSPEPDAGRMNNPKKLMETKAGPEATAEGFVQYDDDRAVFLVFSPDRNKLIISSKKFAAHTHVPGTEHSVVTLPDANVRGHIRDVDEVAKIAGADSDVAGFHLQDLEHTSSGMSTPKYHTRETRVYAAAIDQKEFDLLTSQPEGAAQSEGTTVIDVSSVESIDAFIRDALDHPDKQAVFLDPALVAALYRMRLMRSGKFPDMQQKEKNLQVEKPEGVIVGEMSGNTDNWFEFVREGEEEFVVSGNETLGIAFDEEGNVLLMKEKSPANEYREIVMAVSGGWKPNRISAVENMRKEMLEELGRPSEATNVYEIGWLAPNPDVLTTQTRVCVMTNVGAAGKRADTADEVTEIFDAPMSLDALDQQIYEGGVLIDNRTIAALYMARVYLEK